MIFNKSEYAPKTEAPILIAVAVDDYESLFTGWYDLNEQDYYKDDGDILEFESVLGWATKTHHRG